MLDLRTVIILNIYFNFYILCLQQICVSMEEEYNSAIYDICDKKIRGPDLSPGRVCVHRKSVFRRT